MDIRTFLSDDQAQRSWLEKEKLSMDSAGEYFSWWPHGETKGFGIVVTGLRRSMELHLMPNCEVSRHMDEFDQNAKVFNVLVSDYNSVSTLSDFERLYSELKNRTINGS